ncbi:hypothetical protein P7C70_g7881, partial [Phenoliferia sp. Uapishka_3]
MAQSSTTRELSLQERFRALASYTATDVVPSFHYPDNSGLDAQASTSNGALGFRLIPHHFETCPRWDNDAIMTVSGMRKICRKEAKVIKIPPGHRALLQYGSRLVEYMIEGGAEIDVYGRGSQHINIYGFAEDRWSDPTIGLHYQEPGFHGYISERFFEAIIDGLGRQRTQGLGRLVASSIETEGGIRKEVTRGKFKTSRLVSQPKADQRSLAILATTCLAPAPTASPTTQRALSPSPGSQLETQTVALTPHTPSPTVHALTPARKMSPTTGTSPSAPKPGQHPLHTTSKASTKPSASAANRKSSPPSPTTASAPADGQRLSRRPSPQATLLATAQIKPAVPSSTLVAQKPAPQVSVAKNGQPASPSSNLVAPAMERSEGMSTPAKQGENIHHLSGAQKRKLRRIARSVKLAVAAAKSATTATTLTTASPTASPTRAPLSPPSVSLASCRASAAATLREVTARAEQRNAITHPLPARPMAVNSVQRLAPLEVLAPGISSAKVYASGELEVQKKKSRIANLTILELEAELESRKRKSSPTQPSLRGDTESLFRRNARLRQPHDWRTEEGPDSRNNGNIRSNLSDPLSLNKARYPGSLDDVPYPRTPVRASQHNSNESHLGNYYDRDYQDGNGREGRGLGRGLQRPIALNDGRPSRFDQGSYYPGNLGGRYVLPHFTSATLADQNQRSSILDYGEQLHTSPTQARAAREPEQHLSRQPIAVPQVPTKGPKFSRPDIIGSSSLVGAFAQTLEKPTTYGKTTSQAENTTIVSKLEKNVPTTGFSRVVCPPPSAQHSLRATAASFFPTPASFAPETSTDPRTRPPPSSYSSHFYPPSFDLLPGGPPKPTTVFAAGSAQLVAGEIEAVESNRAGMVKKEESDVFGPGLEESGWEVVKRSKKVGACAVSNNSRMLTRSRATKGEVSQTGQTQVRLRRLPGDIGQQTDALHTVQDVKPVVASPARPSLRPGASFKPTLSSIGATRIEDEWTTEMDMEISGEPLLDQGESWELTKTHRQNKVAKSSLKTREQRKSREFFKWLGQEEIRLWEEFKKENGPLRIGGLKKKEWVPVSGAI